MIQPGRLAPVQPEVNATQKALLPRQPRKFEMLCDPPTPHPALPLRPAQWHHLDRQVQCRMNSIMWCHYPNGMVMGITGDLPDWFVVASKINLEPVTVAFPAPVSVAAVSSL